MPTVSVTVARDVTEAIKVPRALFVPWPMGHHFGVPFDIELQRVVVLTALAMLENSQEPGTIVTLPIKWAYVRRQARVLTEQGRKL